LPGSTTSLTPNGRMTKALRGTLYAPYEIARPSHSNVTNDIGIAAK
jgi:hypothetical protein